MKKYMKKQIQELAPFYFVLLAEIERIEQLGYEIIELNISSKQLNQLFTVNTILTDGGLDPIVVWKKEGADHNIYYNDIIINSYSKNLGFKIEKSEVDK